MSNFRKYNYDKKKKGERLTGSLAQAGRDSYDTVCVTASFALVRAFVIPPPAAKLLKR